MPKRSAGILMYRRRGSGLELLLVHPGGPFWAKKDWGAWSIPKGEYSEGEDALAVAMREFEEETGARALGRSVGARSRGVPGPARALATSVERRAGEPGFEPGFTVLETARITINSLPRSSPTIAAGRARTPTTAAPRRPSR